MEVVEDVQSLPFFLLVVVFVEDDDEERAAVVAVAFVEVDERLISVFLEIISFAGSNFPFVVFALVFAVFAFCLAANRILDGDKNEPI